ncbi:MAG: hypothetical protein K6B74_04745 [Ruminococcus sp.]|nr:hypothetical protein [Ruminococcus sp.]
MSEQNNKPLALDDTPKGRKGIEEMLERMSKIKDNGDSDNNKANKTA